MKKIFMLLVAALAFTGVKAAESVIWEGTYEDGIEISSETVATIKSGDVLRIYLTVPDGGANFKICYKGEPDWSETAIPSLDSQWPWVNGGETYKDISLTESDLTAMQGKSIFIYQGDNSVITKVSLITAGEEPTPDPVAVEQTVWEGNEAISWNTEVAPGTQFETPSGIFAGLKKDDVVRVYTTTTYDEPQYVLTYKKGDSWEWTDLATTVSAGVISFTVADETMATEIADRGLVVRGQAYTIVKITVTKAGSTTNILPQSYRVTTDDRIYNLRGQQVSGKTMKGVYVHNGKKVVLK